MNAKIYLVIFTTIISTISQTNSQSIEISSNWVLTNQNGSIEIKDLSIPITVHTALRSKKLISDPLYRFNDINQRWIMYEPEWSFSNTFLISTEINLNSTRIQLVLNRVDTIASVYLNNKLVTNIQNEFLKHTIEDINAYLVTGVNKIVLKFTSPVLYAAQQAKAYSYRVPVDYPPDVQHGEGHVNFIRKKQSSFSWDWGPAFGPIGIYEPVSLNIIQSFDFNFSASIYPNPSSSGLNDWFIDNEIIIMTEKSQINTATTGLVKLSLPETGYETQTKISVVNATTKLNFIFRFNASKYPIELWYPRFYGKQKLYELKLECTLFNQSASQSKTIGFRKVELIQKPIALDIEGLTFYFEVNNIPVFLKGSNWVPLVLFEDQSDFNYLKWLLSSVAESNMNVLRVWGGGQYETEEFYALADQLGILIWQDFMFACSMYPTNVDFLKNVEMEVLYQLRRLRHHPCIAVWAGNNENEAALADNWYNTNENKNLYYDDYRKLYVEVIRKSVEFVDAHARPFLVSSPTNGLESQREDWIAKNPYDVRFGDLHFYDYSIDGWDWEKYPVARFASEFGFQSWPSVATLLSAFDKDDLAYFGELSNHRQHHALGSAQILLQILLHFRLPSAKEPLENFKSLVYLSQINQAMSYKTATEVYRRNRDFIDPISGIGKSMGVMYWQLNDVWQAPTWSSIEYGGRWKFAHYYMKKAFAPIILSPVIDKINASVDVYIVSDWVAMDYEDKLLFKVFSFQSFSPVFTKLIPFSVKALSTTVVLKISLKEVVDICEAYNCLMTFEFASANEALADGSNFLFYNNNLNKLQVKSNNEIFINYVNKITDDTFEIQMFARQVSFFVWLDVADFGIKGRFSDNGFHMSDPMKNVTFVSLDKSLTAKTLRTNLNITFMN